MNDKMMKIAIFQKEEIRKQLHGGEWWFVITDAVAALTDTSDPARYVRDLRYRDEGIKELTLKKARTKGRRKFRRPFPYPSTPLVANKSSPVGTPKASSASSNPSPAKKLSPSNAS